MQLNTVKSKVKLPKKKRVARGVGSSGKTAGRGHKGQRSRRDRGNLKLGFEGGQMSYTRRLPKRGFRSMKQPYVEVIRLHELNNIDQTEITLDVLKKHDLVRHTTKIVRIIAKGEIKKPITVKGMKVTKGAREAIEKAGGQIEE